MPCISCAAPNYNWTVDRAALDRENLKQTDIARLENVQYRAAKIVCGALHFTNKDKLNSELGWESIIERGDILGLNIFKKLVFEFVTV